MKSVAMLAFSVQAGQHFHTSGNVHAKRLSCLASTVCWMKQKLTPRLPITLLASPLLCTADPVQQANVTFP